MLVKKSVPLHPTPQKVREMPTNIRIENNILNPSLQSKILLPESNTWRKHTINFTKPVHSLNEKGAAAVSIVDGKDIYLCMALEGDDIPWQQSLPLSSAVIKSHLSLSPYQPLIKGSNDPQAEKCN